ncbi:vegetative incompatibility protein HET-E-1 [Ilyonectria destructans]|nr:vegetative incompatibility protein HET-E-1 [Ilyonectria destructans]
MEAVGVAANVIAVVDISIKVASLCVQYAKDVKNASADIERLKNEVANLEGVAKAVQKLLNNSNSAKLNESQELKNNLNNTRSQLKTLHLRLTPRTSRKTISKIGLHALKWPFQSKEVDGLVETLRRYAETIDRTLQVEQTGLILHIDETLLSIDQKTVLSRLPVAMGASFDSSAEEHNPICLQDTRVDLLRHIHEWALDPNAKSMFWLNGMAGTGKSTISRTIARSFSESGHLGGSFFFKRGEGDRGSLSKFFSTIASQLAKREPAIAPHIKATIDADPHIAGKAVRNQFSELVMRPLSSIVPGTWRSDTLVVVVDALDECDRDEDIKLLINLFSSTTDLQFPKLKTLITSRPELPLRLGFNAVKGTYQDLVLHEIPPGIIEDDISTFFSHELTKIKIEYNSSVLEDRHLPLDWPGKANVQLLVKRAIPLFIFAATICRFISDRNFGDPNAQLKEVLQFQRQGQMSQLSATYLPILNRLVDGMENRQRDHLIERFRHIVGSIVVLGNPLPISALGRLLNTQKETVHAQMDLLHSVLSIPSSEQSPVRMLHLSFRDFLVDPEECGNHPFWVDKKQAHNQLAMCCLTIMNESLETDICKLRQPGTDRGSISPQEIGSYILPEVQYACLYWVYHIQQADICVDDDRPVYDFLLQHFLHWLEVLSLISKASESLTIIKDLQAVSKVSRNRMLADFLQDAQRFILTNISTIDSTPLQIYSSVLAFTPKNSAIRMAFFQDYQIPKWISLAPEPEDNWDQCQQILEGHTHWVTSVAFSHDSTVVASASNDETIRLWRVDDSACIQELKGHTHHVTSVAFSYDSTVVASASWDETIRLWRVDDGVCIQEFKGRTPVLSVAFSHDSTVIASASLDETIRLWRVNNGACIQELKGHTKLVTSVAFSHDSTVVASASKDETIRLWRVDDGACIQELKGHTERVTSVAFSHDSTVVASASWDKTIRLWRVDGACIQELKGHTVRVTSVAFSHDSTVVASASDDETIRLWRVDDGICIQELKGHTSWVKSVAFSHNSTVVASASDDKTIRLWRVDNGTSIQELKGHTERATSVAFSYDLTVVASASDDETTRLWRVDNGACIQELKGHTSWITSVAFSPDSTVVASASWDKTIRLWRVDDGACIQELKGHTQSVTSVAFLYSSTVMASASNDETIRLWRVNNGTCIQELKGHTNWVISVAFSYDLTVVASGSDDKTTRLWRVDNGACIQELKGHTQRITSVAFSHDSTVMASASRDETIRLWRVNGGACIQELKGHTSWVMSVAFSPDSTVVASASDDKTIRLWCVDDGVCTQEVTGISSFHLQFDRQNSCLLTDAGAISLKSPVLSPESITIPFTHCLSGIGISEDRCWIMWKKKRLLWLPAPFRPECSTVSGLSVILGCSSGRVIFMRFVDLWLLD